MQLSDGASVPFMLEYRKFSGVVMAKNTRLLSGKHIASRVIQTIRHEWQKFDDDYCPPRLGIIQVGDDAASQVYINRKTQACHSVGFETVCIHLPDTASQQTILSKIHELNHDDSITGILLQLPLPPQCFISDLLEAIAPHKDVDALTPTNMGRLLAGNYDLLPCTTAAILALLQSSNVDLPGKRVVMVGASALVGKPTAIALLHHNATITICHSLTKDLRFHVQQAQILIVAIGNPNVIQHEWIPENCVVIDVGINRARNNQIVGDIPTERVIDKVSLITPVPGGVGPVTVAYVVKNLFTLFCRKRIRDSAGLT